MTTLAAYLDDSGTHEDSRVYMLAGYLAPTEKWKRLSEDWEHALKRWSIPWMHMNSAEQGQKHFRSWKKARRRRCIHAFANIVGRHAEYGIVPAIAHQSFRTMVKGVVSDDKRLLREYADTYTHALTLMLVSLRKLCLHKGIQPGEVEVVIAEQAKGGRAIANIGTLPARLGFSAPLFMNPRKHPPLQAADMFAWSHNRFMSKHPGAWMARHLPLRKPGIAAPLGHKEVAMIAAILAAMRRMGDL